MISTWTFRLNFVCVAPQAKRLWRCGSVRWKIDWTWFSKLVVIGEIAVGVALLLGLLTGIAAFFGGFMNWNFIMAGAASSNGMLFLISVLLVLAWKVAGYWGLDRWVLPRLGTPWPKVPLDQVPRAATNSRPEGT